ncbi:efflux RND transporter periplasmic adaptor subunit [Massilia litorea]|uniref:Efflux RND transporter periplasmic adaptor subunit n=1 Tax=Massilia litorea TaxID=2769491 RepID=A0A7L9U6D7_9BURK|nr:efflux RND transporter periplasmic adaptor subunit [Massilia litorea]QOL50440.1 efflux RND transporter periplasmic adaptor subunit [Massilia litorea]
MKKNTLAVIAIVVAAGAGGAWYMNRGAHAEAESAQGGAGGKGGAQPPTTVNVITPQRQDVGVDVAANGTVTPQRTVDLRPQTTSTIRQVHIKEGQFVKAGQLMFSLDDRSDRASVAQAEAEVARGRASLADLERQYKRSQDLVAQKFLAQSAVDTLRSQVEGARAALAASSAAVRASQVNASYTSIRAPMAGRVGAINVYPGSLVQPATSLTTVTQLDPIDVAFTLPESSLGSLLAAQKQGKVAVEASTGADAKPVTGELSFVDNTVDPTSGTIRVKAQFGNSDGLLWPGQYVNTRVTVRTIKDAVVIPQNAIIINAQGTFVYVAEKDGTARQVPIARQHAFGLNAAVTGLNGDEQVITEGKQNLRPGGKVRLAGAKQQGTQQAAPAGKDKAA